MAKKKKTVFKQTSTSLGLNVLRTLPMIEEITAHGLIPICVIGFSAVDKPKIQLRFATLTDEHDPVVLEFCKQLIADRNKTA